MSQGKSYLLDIAIANKLQGYFFQTYLEIKVYKEIIFFLLYVDYYEIDLELGLDSAWAGFQGFKKHKDAEHSGDCTKNAWPCTRCQYESVQGDAEKVNLFLVKKIH